RLVAAAQATMPQSQSFLRDERDDRDEDDEDGRADQPSGSGGRFNGGHPADAPQPYFDETGGEDSPAAFDQPPAFLEAPLPREPRQAREPREFRDGGRRGEAAAPAAEAGGETAPQGRGRRRRVGYVRARDRDGEG